MKRVLSTLFFWGAMSLTQSLSADVVYHLSVLVDSNVNDSIALVNLFPGNSSVSVTNPDTGRREVFTVQQRIAIGRKIVLSPNSASRLNLGPGSIVEVRIVELAFNNDNAMRDVNPASEYQDIVAGPLNNDDEDATFARPSLEAGRPLASRDSVPSTPSGTVGELPAGTVSQTSRPPTSTDLTDSGLPPVNQSPAPPVMNREDNSYRDPSPADDSLVINTNEEKLLIPLPMQPDETPARKPLTNLNAGDLANVSASKEKKTPEPPPVTAMIPSGDPFTSKDSHALADNTSKSKPQISSTLPSSPVVGKEPEELNTFAPPADLNAAPSESIQETSQPNLGNTNPGSDEPNLYNGAVQRMGDARPIGGSPEPGFDQDIWQNPRTKTGKAKQSSETTQRMGDALPTGRGPKAASNQLVQNTRSAELEKLKESKEPKEREEPKKLRGDSVVQPMGDALPSSPSLGPTSSRTGTPTKNEIPDASSIPKEAEIYFPTVGDMNPPPGSGTGATLAPLASVTAEERSSEPDEKSGRTVTPSGDNRRTLLTASPTGSPANPTSPTTPQKLLKPKDIAQPAATKVRVIGNLNSLDLPSGYYIQLASFKDVRKTRQVYEQFIHEYKMNVVPAQINGKKYYRCLIGNLNESEVAEILRKVRAAGYEDAFVYKNR